MATKCMSCGGAAKKMKKGGITQDIVGMPGYNARTDTMKKGGVAKPKKFAVGGSIVNPATKYAAGGSTSVSHRCPPGTARLASGGCGERPLYGG